jgi:hypothetical protein
VSDPTTAPTFRYVSAENPADVLGECRGEKASSFGPREQGMAALEIYSSTRTITVSAQ